MNSPTIRRLSDVTKHERVARNIYRTELGKIAMTKDLTTCRKPNWPYEDSRPALGGVKEAMLVPKEDAAGGYTAVT